MGDPGDVNFVKIGAYSTIQDNVVIHVAKTNPKGEELPTVVGSKCIIGAALSLGTVTLARGPEDTGVAFLQVRTPLCTHAGLRTAASSEWVPR